MAVNMLVSFAFFAGEDLGRYRAVMPCGRLMVDSGAYTAASTGQVIRRQDYAEFLNTWEHVIDHAVTLDVIGDPRGTAANTAWLHKRGHAVMPVFTRGGKAADFDAMVRDCGYVCVGGGVGMSPPVVIRRLAALQRRAEELGGGIHALGVGNLAGLRKIRPYSADASNVSSTFRYGTVVVYDGRRLHTVAHSNQPQLRKVQHLLKAQGVSASDLVRLGRQPTGVQRDRMIQGFATAYACADEDTVRLRVPVPHGTDDSPGCHIYASMTGNHLAAPVAELDKLLHSGPGCLLWEQYRPRHRHQCRAS